MPNNRGSRLGPLGLACLVGLLLAGGLAAGLGLASGLAPGSLFAQLVGAALLPLCLAIGLSSWYAAASAAVWRGLSDAMCLAFTGVDFDEAVERSMRDLPRDGEALPGTHVFLPVSLAVSALAALLIGLVPGAAGFPVVLPAVLAAGLGYGSLLRVLARRGYLPIPDKI